MNKTSFTGRFTADPELRTTSQGNEVCHFTLAVRKKYYKKNADGQYPAPDFLPFVAWKNMAKIIAENCHKGSHVLIQGPLESRYFTAHDGKRKYIVEVRVEDIEFLDKKPKASEAKEKEPAIGDFAGQPVSDEEIPLIPS